LDTASIKITIVSLSYRDKRIIDTIKSAYDNAFNKDSISLSLAIQDSHNHKVQSFGSSDVVRYHLWDQNMGFARIRSNLVRDSNEESYLLFISSATEFKANWDVILTEYVKKDPNIILSLKDNQFFLDGALIKKNVLKKVGYPDYLRLMGEQEDISIRLYANGYKISSGIKNVINVLDKKEYDYIPFSITHHYNEVWDLYNSAKNRFTDLSHSYEKCIEYANKYPIKKIYHQLNDVLYLDSEVGELDDLRFYNHGSRI
jgi:hypothetical protein